MMVTLTKCFTPAHFPGEGKKWMMCLMHLTERQGKMHPKRVTWWHSRVWKAYLQIGLNLKVWVSQTGSLSRRLLKNFQTVSITAVFWYLSMLWPLSFSSIITPLYLWLIIPSIHIYHPYPLCDVISVMMSLTSYFISLVISIFRCPSSTDCWSEVSMLWRFNEAYEFHSWKKWNS